LTTSAPQLVSQSHNCLSYSLIHPYFSFPLFPSLVHPNLPEASLSLFSPEMMVMKGDYLRAFLSETNPFL
jgi:hypothetical protein